MKIAFLKRGQFFNALFRVRGKDTSQQSSLDNNEKIDHFSEFDNCESAIDRSAQFANVQPTNSPTLADWLNADQPLPSWQVATRHLIKVATEIAAIHDDGILHGDLKPATIQLLKSEHSEALDLANWNPKLANVGLAIEHQVDGKWPYRNGIPLGSPRYLAPELFSDPDTPLSPTLDVYSFGIIMFELLIGQHPFEATRFVNVGNKTFVRKAPSLLDFNPKIPAGLNEITLGCLCQENADRYQTFPEIIAKLRSLVPRKRIQSSSSKSSLRCG